MQFLRTHYLYLVLPVLAFAIARLAFGIDGLYGQDSYEYLRFTKAIYAGFKSGNLPSNFFWPVGYPLVSSIFMFTGIPAELSLQLVSLFSLIGVLFYLHYILLPFANNVHVLKYYLIACVLFSPLVFRSAIVCMSDMLCVFFVVGHIHYSLRYLKELKAQHLLGAVVFAVGAVFTRYGSAVIVAATSVMVAVHFFRNFKMTHLLLALLGFATALVPHFMFTNNGVFHFTGHQWLTDWNIGNLFKSNFVTNDGQMQFQWPNIVFYILEVFHPRFFVALVPILLFAILKKKKVLYSYLLIPIVIYLIFLSGIKFQNTRFVLPLIPYFAIVLFPVYEELVVTLPYKKILAIIFVAGNLFLTFLGFSSLYSRMRLESAIVSTLNEKYPKRQVYSFDMEVALKGRSYNGDVHSLFDSVYVKFDNQTLILFNVDKIEKQWTGRAPMQNWNNLQTRYSLEQIETFEEGWRLYEVK